MNDKWKIINQLVLKLAVYWFIILGTLIVLALVCAGIIPWWWSFVTVIGFAASELHYRTGIKIEEARRDKKFKRD